MVGIATGLTAARMQEIIDKQIASGAVDLSGKLIFTREDGSTFDAGTVKGTKGDPAAYPATGFPISGTATYVRLATLDGLNATTGAHAQFILSGVGPYSGIKRGTVLAHATQRGDDLVDLKAWGWGLNEATANSLRLYTRKTGTYLFEIWALVLGNTASLVYQDLSKWRATINMDGNTTSAPSNLVLQTILRADVDLASDSGPGVVELATPGEALTGTAGDRAVTPAGLRYSTNERSIPKGPASERDSYYGVPTTLADQVTLANKKPIWFNTDFGWEESYYVATGSAGLTALGLVTGTPSGWYPVGRGPRVIYRPSASNTASAGFTLGGWSGNRWANVDTTWFEYVGGIVNIGKAGRYKIGWRTALQTGAGELDMWLYAGSAFANTAWELNSTRYKTSEYEFPDIAIAAGESTRAYVNAGTCSVHMSSSTLRGAFYIEYLGPSLATV